MSHPVRGEKMSKSRGNVVTIDEVVHGISELDPSVEFRFGNGQVIADYKAVGVWRDSPGDSMFYTATRHGKQPVFLHEKDNPFPAMLLIHGSETIQHPGEFDLWWGILERNGLDPSEYIER